MATGDIKPYIYQEFQCNKCPGFFVVRLNAAITGKVLMVCPICKREHQRDVIKGVIVDIGKDADEKGMHKIHVPKAAFSKTPKTKVLEYAKKHIRDSYDRRHRNGVRITEPDDLIDPKEFYKYEG